MATTVNNTTANSKITIIFDAGVNPSSANDGPRLGTGNTESDVCNDSKSYLNIRSHTEVNENIHALQWNAATNSGELEYTDTRQNESVSEFPQWATNVVIRCEAQDKWQTAYDNNVTAQMTAWTDAGNDGDNFVVNNSQATSVAETARTDYLSAHSITY